VFYTESPPIGTGWQMFFSINGVRPVLSCTDWEQFGPILEPTFVENRVWMGARPASRFINVRTKRSLPRANKKMVFSRRSRLLDGLQNQRGLLPKSR
jgi:hypothetical protein